MAEYAGINTDGLAVSGMWAVDSLLVDGETLVELTGEATIGWTYTDGAWVAPLVGINEVRGIRDTLLSETDWRMVSDYPEANQDEWKTYRQELRDLPNGYRPIAGSGIIWPTKPS
jgi:hypothetical protein